MVHHGMLKIVVSFNFRTKYIPRHGRRYQGNLVPVEEKFPNEDEKFLLDHQESHHNVLHLDIQNLLEKLIFCKDGKAQFTRVPFTALSDLISLIVSCSFAVSTSNILIFKGTVHLFG